MRRALFALALSLTGLASLAQSTPPPNWLYLSTENFLLEKPGESQQQTASLVTDLNGDGLNDFVIAARQKAPALVGYLRTKTGWQRQVLEPEYLTIEAGGAAQDLDGDGDQDLVFGGDWQSNHVWWWENPGAAGGTWKRYDIKAAGNTQHHDQLFGDFKRTGTPQLVFWNQGSKSLYLAEIPRNPKTDQWRFEPIFSGEAGEKGSWYAEGLAKGDVDGDGWLDLLAGNYWFRYVPGTRFKAIRIAEQGGRVAVGKFKAGKYPQIVISPGDGTGKLMLYEYTGQPERDSPEDSTKWVGRDLLGRTMIHGHTLELGDINHDGYLDIFTAEMAKWSEKSPEPDNPVAEALLFYGDGQGGFRKEVFKTGWGFHEARLADLDGDADLDILSKPYTWKAPRLDVWLQNGTEPRVIPGELAQQKVGLELYSFRDAFKTDVPGTLAKVRAMGFREVELAGYYDRTPEQMKELLDANGLKATGGLYGFERFRDDVDGIIREAKLFGLPAVGCAWIPHQKIFTKADAEKGAAVFNAAGEKLRAAGLGFYYHCHGYEFRPTTGLPAGTTLFDYLATLMKPGVADFQIDVYWALHGGADPARLIAQYPDRIRSLHLKDMAWGQETGLYTGGAPLENDCVHGQGQQNFGAILRAAAKAGVKTMYIEDENAKALTQVPQSLAYLRGLK
jgi:sugar phosphate isomerase/epimerase